MSQVNNSTCSNTNGNSESTDKKIDIECCECHEINSCKCPNVHSFICVDCHQEPCMCQFHFIYN